MAGRNAITVESLTRGPLPAWAAALLAGQGVAGAHGQIGSEILAALTAGALLAWFAGRYRLAAAVLLFVSGCAHVTWVVEPPADPSHVMRLAPGRVHLRARVVGNEERDAGRLRLLLDVDAVERGGQWGAGRGLIQLTVADAGRDYATGTRLEAVLTLRRPRNFGNPGELDYEGYLARRGIHVISFVRGDEGLMWLGGASRGWVDRWRDDVRAQLAELENPARAILGALLLGDLGALPRQVRDEFAAAGVSHVLSISGLHVAMVGGCAYAAARWLLARSRWLLLTVRVPVLAVGLSLLPVFVYAELARAGVATGRALIMLTVVVAAVVLGRRRDMPASIAAAAIAVSLVWPGAVLDVSFQLSFVAVAALVLVMEKYGSWRRRRRDLRLGRARVEERRWLAWLMTSVTVNAGILAATAPLTAYHFNQVPLIGLLANPLVVPLVGTAAVALGLLGALAALVAPGLAPWIFTAAGEVAGIGALLTSHLAALPGAGLRTISPSSLDLLAYAALASGAILRGRIRRRGLAVVAIAATLDAAWWARERFFRPGLRVTFLSVGQGDATVIEFPGSEVMVIDGGGLYGFDTGERIVAPYLWRRKIARVDYLVLTHPQFDHYGGLAYVARHFAPRELWHNGRTSAAASYVRLQEEIAANEGRWVYASAGMAREIGGCRVDVLWPPSASARLGVNDASLVLRIECGEVSLLFPGDLERGGEKVAASASPLASDVLKAGHHGSRTSSTPTWLDAVGARTVVISAGYANRFGFPSPEVLAALERRGVDVHRTDRDGAVILRAGANGRVRWQRTHRNSSLPRSLTP